MKLLDRVVRGENFVRWSCEWPCERDVASLCLCEREPASLCMLYKIVGNRAHPVYSYMPETFVPSRVTRLSVSLHDRAFVPVRYRTDQYGGWFIARVVGMWNALDNTVFARVGLCAFNYSINTFLLSR